MPLTLPDPQLPGDPQDALQSIQRNFEALAQTLAPPVPTGTLLPFAAGVAPFGYLICDGSEVAVMEYPALDALLGTTYGARTNGSGGVGNSHFRLPDLQNRVPTGRGSGVFANLGSTGGELTTELQTIHMPPHTHGSGTLENSPVGNHSHGGGDLRTAFESNHFHGPGNLKTEFAGVHDHATFGSTVDNTTTGGGGTRVNALTGSASGTTGSTSSNGSHQHDVNQGTTGDAGGHFHVLTSGQTSLNGGHGHTISGSTAEVGGAVVGGVRVTQPHNNLAPYITVTYIIKA